MKKILIFLLLITGLIFSCNKEIEKDNIPKKDHGNVLTPRGITDCVPDEIQDPLHPCFNSFMYTINTPIILAQYPNCVFDVSIDVRVCYDFLGRPINYLIFDWRWTTSPFFCTNFLNDVINAFNNNTITSFIAIYDNSMLNAIEDYFFNQAVQQGGSTFYYCGTNPPLKIGFYRSNCYRYCFGVLNGQWTIRRSVCGTSCCERKTEICIDPITKKVDKKTTVRNLSSCSYIAPQPNWCDIPNASTTDCIQLCEQ